MPVTKSKKYSAEEYLQLERQADHKSEYFQGEIFAMSGASFEHNVIAGNLFALLHSKLKDKGCRPFAADMRLHVPINTLYTYPDIMVVCGKEELLDQQFDTMLNPTFIAEVLSPSTVDYDTGRKFTLYRSIPSLKEYWTISSYEYRLQKFVKNESNNTWILSEYTNKEGDVTLECLELTVPLKDLYDGVNF
jgi:Uma2 family endonuclease